MTNKKCMFQQWAYVHLISRHAARTGLAEKRLRPTMIIATDFWSR